MICFVLANAHANSESSEVNITLGNYIPMSENAEIIE
jgi:hypothetical protein